MPVTYGLSAGEVALISLGWIDPKTHELVELAAFAFKDVAEFKRHWAMIPENDDKTPCIADEYNAAGDLGDTKAVTVEFVELITGRPIQEMIDEGRAAVRKIMREWNADRRKKAAFAAQPVI